MPYVAGHMRDAGLIPDTVLCSSALRARQTLDLLRDALPADREVLMEEALYTATGDALLQRLQTLPGRTHRAMLIGHNPALQQVALMLARSGDELGRMTRKFPTAALATLEAVIDDWSDLVAGCARLTGFVRPKALSRRSG